jgi:hypothetical protein
MHIFRGLSTVKNALSALFFIFLPPNEYLSTVFGRWQAILASPARRPNGNRSGETGKSPAGSISVAGMGSLTISHRMAQRSRASRDN